MQSAILCNMTASNLKLTVLHCKLVMYLLLQQQLEQSQLVTRKCPADTRAWEVDTLRGHVNNVSCVMFHARQVRLSLFSARAVLPYS